MIERIQVSASRVPIIVVVMVVACACSGVSQAQQVTGQQVTGANSVLPHENGEYVGLTKCAACHFDQYKDWKGSEHNRAFEILPLKYRTDATCLECHTTGLATDTTTQQFGVSCESCHGPGEEHSKLALRFVNEIITEEGLTTLRGKIQRLDMLQCVKCHVSKAHKKHPPYDREEVLPSPARKGSVSFFDSIHNRETTIATGASTVADPAGGPPHVETRLVREDR